jgi:hypothetical protein
MGKEARALAQGAPEKTGRRDLGIIGISYRKFCKRINNHTLFIYNGIPDQTRQQGALAIK